MHDIDNNIAHGIYDLLVEKLRHCKIKVSFEPGSDEQYPLVKVDIVERSKVTLTPDAEVCFIRQLAKIWTRSTIDILYVSVIHEHVHILELSDPDCLDEMLRLIINRVTIESSDSDMPYDSILPFVAAQSKCW